MSVETKYQSYKQKKNISMIEIPQERGPSNNLNCAEKALKRRIRLLFLLGGGIEHLKQRETCLIDSGHVQQIHSCSAVSQCHLFMSTAEI